MGELIYLAERRSVRTSRHGDDYDDERAGDVDDELTDRDAGLTAPQGGPGSTADRETRRSDQVTAPNLVQPGTGPRRHTDGPAESASPPTVATSAAPAADSVRRRGLQMRVSGGRKRRSRRRGSMVRAMQPGGRGGEPSPTGLADVIEIILDQGLVIDAYLRLSLVGIEVLTIDARIVVASVDTYLRFAEAVSRLDISREKEGLPGLVGDSQHSSAIRKTKGVLRGMGVRLREFAESESLPASGRLRSREGY
jgi:gas vesicle structural protein